MIDQSSSLSNANIVLNHHTSSISIQLVLIRQSCLVATRIACGMTALSAEYGWNKQTAIGPFPDKS